VDEFVKNKMYNVDVIHQTKDANTLGKFQRETLLTLLSHMMIINPEIGITSWFVVNLPRNIHELPAPNTKIYQVSFYDKRLTGTIVETVFPEMSNMGRRKSGLKRTNKKAFILMKLTVTNPELLI
jgi:hypothetical protein